MQHSPISNKERLLSIDIIRGFALFGIFIVNVPIFFSPSTLLSRYNIAPDYTHVDHVIRLLFDLFVQGKFYPMFSFLFGLGFYIFISRAIEKGTEWKSVYLRRIIVLFVFGILHLLFLWAGDILHTYAIAGVFLLLFYRRSHALIVTTAVCLLIVFYMFYLSILSVPSDALAHALEMSAFIGMEKVNEAFSVYQSFSYADWLPYHWREEVAPVLNNEPYVLPNIFAMFLLGLYAGKKGVFHQPLHHIKLLSRVRNWSFALSIPLLLSLAALELGLYTIDPYDSVLASILIAGSGTSLCLFYIASLTVLCTKQKWYRILQPLSFVGRTALTNYMLQSLLSFYFFIVLRHYGEITLAEGVIFCLIIFPLQILFSFLWLKAYQYGPLEWVWRSLTYRRLQPMRYKIKTSVKD